LRSIASSHRARVPSRRQCLSGTVPFVAVCHWLRQCLGPP
jgi:hypothetical protein